MRGSDLDFLRETICELDYRRNVINLMRADWLQNAIIKDKEYDSFIENLETAYRYCDFAVATLQGVVDVAEKFMSEKET